MRNAFIALHVSILLAGWTAVFGKMIQLTPMMIVWWRIFIGGSVILLFVTAFKKLETCTGREIRNYLILGICLAYQWMLFYAGIKASNISIGVITFSTIGFFTAIFEPLLSNKRISVREVLLSLITILGVALIFHFDSRYRLGLAYGTASAAGAALIAVYMKRFRNNHGSLTVLTWQFVGAFIGATLMVPFYLYFYDPDTVLIPSLWPDLPNLFIFATVITLGMYGLQLVALKHVSAFTVNLSYNLEPVYAIAMAVLFFGEARELNASFWAGLGLIMLSVVLQSLAVVYDLKKTKKPQ